MRSADAELLVKSHVTRDLLHSAGLFKTDKQVVWEYVANSLQYVDPGVRPVVRVVLDAKAKQITIIDNGRGMDMEGLRNFFVMHGVNQDRRVGRPGRGRFGTGKSAAFGIADRLQITTVLDGKRSSVMLRRADIDAMDSESPIPVKVLEREVPCDAPNGTIVKIEGIHLRALDQAAIIQYIERHLAHYPKHVKVLVNNHECEFTEPPMSREERFRPEGALREILGDVELVIKVAKAPLDESLRGIAIFSNGVWHESTLAGAENREMAQYLFGEIDVPALDNDDMPIPAFDISRSMRLNPANEVVQAIYSFIGPHIDAVRRELVDADRRRRAEEQNRRLAAQASAIARVLNDDFAAFRQQVARVRAIAAGRVDPQIAPSPWGEDTILILGNEVPAEEVAPTGGQGAMGTDSCGGSEPRTLLPELRPAGAEEELKGRHVDGTGRQRSARGGFQVIFQPMGAEAHRAKYVSDNRTIYVNLDHPQVVAAGGVGAADEPVFQRLAYEIAFTEYAIALASELQREGHFLDTSDPIVEIRETVNRVARLGAHLYTAGKE
jgi:hypothetical protein